MVMQTMSRALMGLTLLHGVAQGINVYVTNKCEEDMILAHVTPKGTSTDQLAAGDSITKSFPAGTGSHVYKSGLGAQATLAEFSGDGGRCWYDISIIPTGEKSGPEFCSSLQACKDLTGGVGFNVPMQITPHTQDGDRCVELTCLADGCDDAYQFPKDDTKTHTCPLSTDFDITFCPGGSGGSTPASGPVSAPSPKSIPAPVPALEPTLSLLPTWTPPSEETSPKQMSPPSVLQTSLTLTSDVDHHLTGQKQQTVASTISSPVGDENLRKTNAGNAQSSTIQQTTELTDDQTPQMQEPVDVQEANTKSNQSGGNSTPYIVLAIGGCVGMVAAAAIVVVRKKKAQMEELETKTPQSTTTRSALASYHTPRQNVSVL